MGIVSRRGITYILLKMAVHMSLTYLRSQRSQDYTENPFFSWGSIVIGGLNAHVKEINCNGMFAGFSRDINTSNRSEQGKWWTMLSSIFEGTSQWVSIPRILSLAKLATSHKLTSAKTVPFWSLSYTFSSYEALGAALNTLQRSNGLCFCRTTWCHPVYRDSN